MTTATLKDPHDGEFFRFGAGPRHRDTSDDAYYARGGGRHDPARPGPASGVLARVGGLGGPWHAIPDALVTRVDALGEPLDA